IQFDGFIYPAYDQIVTQLAKMRNRSAGGTELPVVIRLPFGGGIGAIEHHSESPEAYFAHTAGLKVVTCSNPCDAYLMIQQAIASNDPVIFFEPKRRYWDKAEVNPELKPGHADAPGLYEAQVVRPGHDATLVAYGPMVKTCLSAAETAKAEDGRELEVVDLRSLSPIDFGPVIDSVRKTGRLVVVHEAPRSFGLGAEIAARVTEDCFYHLEAPVLRVTGFDAPYPPARVEEHYLPDVERVLDGVDRTMGY
ncbi:MAG TPA: transketolase C-terminal domain-containing protein, partial [Mycobacteriales bacterium]|nr:transketolase C-terminal domain-containing protein [Mycobacteriales bacterium]